VTPENKEITTYDTPGELVVRSPSVVLGYLNNEKATAETFVDGWMRTGDEAVIRKSPKGIEHVFIVDRIKELIKVKVRDCTG
jgi:long-subunit acyl-CoA synthetase (AMP-forming)